jgi:hypothetical protein
VQYGQATKPGTNTIDFSDINLLDAPANKGGLTGDDLAAHETLEAYYTSQGESLVDAHFHASRFPGAEGMAGPVNFFDISNTATGNLVGFTRVDNIINRSGIYESTTNMYVTPIPKATIKRTSFEDRLNRPSNITGVTAKTKP